MTNPSNIDVTPSKSVSRFLIGLMAVSAGITVANIYYNQPILKEIAADLGSTDSQAGIVSMLSQVGYGLGLFFLTPLGDKINKKKLIISLQLLLIAALLLVTFTYNIFQLWALSLLISMFSVSVQVIMPMAAGLDAANRGKNVGTIFTGVLIGILAARVFSGSIAEWFGWRFVYLISAGAVALATILLKIKLPNVKTQFDGSYLKLLGSALQQIKRFQLLREVSVVGMLQFGLFCAFWTTLTFYLSGEPFNFSSDIIGLFGLVAIAGALLAPIIGKRADKGGSKKVRFIALGLIVVSILLMIFLPASIPALVLAVFLLDVGAQAIQVTNVAMIYTLDESSHSRINTIYMTSFFTGGAVGTLIGIFCWKYGGWLGVNLQMLLFAVVILLLLLKEKRNSPKN
ncbi:MAG TPA: MFS transporter [Prolixibacteraceae bacterium]|nr:MFS transporter [Prolixibacteraceae bacterium]